MAGTSQGSALALANAANKDGLPLKAKVDVDVQDLLLKSGFSKVPADGVPELCIFEDLARANMAAESSGKVAFTFVDLTQKDMAPLWLTPESIGGRTILPGMEFQLDEHSETHSLAQLSTALKKATAAPRFFRSIH